jgi:hypothetical protein
MAASSSSSSRKKRVNQTPKVNNKNKKKQVVSITKTPPIDKTQRRACDANLELLRLFSRENKNMEQSCYIQTGMMIYGTSQLDETKLKVSEYTYPWNLVLYNPKELNEERFSRPAVSFPKEVMGKCIMETTLIVDLLENSIMKNISEVTKSLELKTKEIHLLPVIEEFTLDNPSFSKLEFCAYKYIFENILGLVLYLVGVKSNIQENEIKVIDYFFAWVDLDSE